MLKKNKNNKGFTLVELLVVIAIIGILAVVAVPALFKNIEKGKVADLESDISAIRSAVLSYYTNNSEYPIDPGVDGKSSTHNDNTTPIFTSNKKTSISGNVDLNSINHKASLAIFSELEGLSFPYGGSYELTNASGEIGANKAVKSPATLYLKITTKDASTTISNDGLNKLAQDLGLELVNQVQPGNTKDSEPQTAGTPTSIFVKADTSAGQIIILPLIKN